MKQRKWTGEEKLAIVMEGIAKGKPVAEICRNHQISQTLYYKWQDKFLEGAGQALTTVNPMKRPTAPKSKGYRRSSASRPSLLTR